MGKRNSLAVLVAGGVLVVACGSHNTGFGDDGGGGNDGGGNPDAVSFPDVTFQTDGTPNPGTGTCADAAASKSYVGCDYWPTVVANNVWSIFDFAVVVANAGTNPADITITGPNAFSTTGTVAPGQLEKFYLPWVTTLKGPDADNCGTATPMTASVIAHGGAYHLVSTVPVTVYQFNALEYKGAGGPTGKSWAGTACPGNTTCPGPPPYQTGCFSFSNDASLLLPSTAMTGHYRVMGQKGWTAQGPVGPVNVMGPYFAVTATVDGTNVTVKTSAAAKVLAGGTIPAQTGAGTFNLTMNAGDVAEIVGATGDTDDFSGSLVTADQPVQVISGVPCIDQPETAPACDHIEESVFPAETLGQHYVVTPPTSPNGNVVGHIVRIYGNVDGTTLTYTPPGNKPGACPTTINAGQVVDCGQVTQSFEIQGNNAFGVGTFMLGGSVVDPNTTPSKGDPSQSFAVAVEQYRTAYIFLAPSDYDVSYVDIIGPPGANVTVDGAAVSPFTAIDANFGISRFKLAAGANGAHTLSSDQPVGIQVEGYGSYTSYQYPGGSNLTAIAPPPVK